MTERADIIQRAIERLLTDANDHEEQAKTHVFASQARAYSNGKASGCRAAASLLTAMQNGDA